MEKGPGPRKKIARLAGDRVSRLQ